MSGGHYEYKYSQLSMLADDIEVDFLDDGDYVPELSEDKKTLNHLDDVDLTEVQKDELLYEIKNIIKDLRILSEKTRDLEWMMSGDISPQTLYERLQKYKSKK